jgi:peptidoglycan/xylan/chitin deacetylase (PgdA/CDA1 family)
MSRSPLPQDYKNNPGTLFEGFESADEWTNSGTGGSKENDLVNFKTGSQSIKLDLTTAGGNFGIQRTCSPALNLAQVSRQMSLWIYCYPNAVTPANWINSFNIYFYNGANYRQINKSGTNFYEGWNSIVLNRTEFTQSSGTPNLEAVDKILIKIYCKTGQTGAMSFDSWYTGVEQDGRVLVTFDDAFSSVYTTAFPYMAARGVKGTIFVIPDKLGTDGYMTEAQLAEMYAAGWDLGNHTYHHWDSPYLAGHTQAEVENELIQCQEWLEDRGYTRASKHVAYPGGGYDDTVLAAMASTGMLTGRTTGVMKQFVPVENIYLLRPHGMPGGSNLAYTYIDLATHYGATIYFYGHKVSNEVDDWAIADFRAFIDYLVASRVKVVTIREWHEGLTNPRFTSGPLVRAAR